MIIPPRTKADIYYGWDDEISGATVCSFDDKGVVDPEDQQAQAQETELALSPITMDDSSSRAYAILEARYRRIVCEQVGLTEAESLQRMRKLFAEPNTELKDSMCIGSGNGLQQDFQRSMDELDGMENVLIRKGLYDPASGQPEFKKIGTQLKEMRRSLRLAFDGLQTIVAFAGSQSGKAQGHHLQELSLKETELQKNQMGVKKEKETKPQMLLSFLLDQLYVRGAKKKGTLVYLPANTVDGIWTHAYNVWGDIDDVCMQLCTESNDTALQNHWMTAASGTLNFVSKYLEKCYKAQFPRLKEDRGKWAFPNGLFNGKNNATFLKWGDSRLKESDIACKYFFNKDDPDAFYFADDEYERILAKHDDDWFALPTNSIQKVMNSQKGMKEDVIVQRWMYSHLGRMIWDLHELDCWDVQMFFKGLGGTGKSTLLKEVEYWYQPSDVGVLGNEIEETFPLESIMDCFIYLAFDVGESFRLSQMLWQCMVCCETVPVARKFKTKINKLWIIPGAMAGNQPPRWNDNGGSVSRRWVIWAFLTKVDDTDPWLQDEMKMETPIILKKCCLAYADAAGQHGQKAMKFCLRETDYFQKNANQLKVETNLLSAFLQSQNILVGGGNTMPLERFKGAFMLYCDKQRRDRPQFTPDYYGDVFQSANITISAEKMSDQWRGKMETDFWIAGVTIEEENL